MHMVKAMLVVVLAALFVCGCSDNGDARGRSVLEVNGVKLTKAELNGYVELMTKIQSLANANLNDRDRGELRKQLADGFADVFINNALVAEYAKSEKVSVSSALKKHYQAKALDSFKALKIMSYKALGKRLGKDSMAYFDKLVEAEALEEAVKRHLAELTPTNLTPEEVSNAQKNIAEYNAMMTKTNALIKARAKMVWERLKKGAKFEDMAAEYSEIESEREDKGEWGTLDINQFKDDVNVFDWAQKLEVGEFTPPIEGDNGLMIMRLDSKDAAKGEYTFSRIFFLLPMFAEKLSDKEILQEVRSRHKDNLFAAKLEELRKTAKIVRPTGRFSPGASQSATNAVPATTESKDK